jgi:hypothetical protein
VNWDTRDKLSEIHATQYGNVWIRRYFDNSKEDPREGRRESVYIFGPNATTPKQLASDCMRPAFAVQGKLMALSCVREAVGQDLLHETKLIDLDSGRVVKTVERCRKPEFPTPNEFSCEVESVDKSGRVNGVSKRFPIK